MNKSILIIAGSAMIVASGVYFALDKQEPTRLDSEQSLLADYENLLEKVENPQTRIDLSVACNNSQKFAQKIQTLEDELSALKKRKIDYLIQGPEPKHPGVCAQDYNGNVMQPGSWELDFDGNQIPPGSWPLDFDTGKPIPPPGWPLGIDGNPLPPGKCPRDYNGNVMQPGSWELDLDGNQIPPGSWPLDFDTGKPIPPPGWPLGIDGNPLPPGSSEIPSGYMPVPGSEVPDLGGNISVTPLQEIMGLEIRIRLELNEFKSLCDKKPKDEKIIPASCGNACSRFIFTACSIENTAEDLQDDYDICIEECPKWSDDTKICFNKKPLKNVSECAHIAGCIGREYNKMKLPEMMKLNR